MSKTAFQYTHYDLKAQRGGFIVEVTLSAVNNVRVMNNKNFELFKKGVAHRYLGGLVKKSPVRIPLPESDHWHVIVDMDGHAALAQSSIKVIPALPMKKASA